MAAYAAVARLERVDVRRVGSVRPDQERLPVPAIDARLEELAGQRFGEDLLERWAAFREQVTMTTFYLFDPESWR